jgi:hypothetical protein
MLLASQRLHSRRGRLEIKAAVARHRNMKLRQVIGDHLGARLRAGVVHGLSGEIAPDRLFLLGGGFSRLILWSFDLDRCDLAGFRVDLDFRNFLRAWFCDVE